MKKSLLLFLMLFPLVSFCQYATIDTTTVEQYCEMVAQGRLLSSKVDIDVNYGEERKFFKSYAVKDENGKLKKFNSVTDALNYLGQQGWTLLNAFPISTASGPMVYHFYFKKRFLKSEVDKAEKEN
jgi:hypothetical protein